MAAQYGLVLKAGEGGPQENDSWIATGYAGGGERCTVIVRLEKYVCNLFNIS